MSKLPVVWVPKVKNCLVAFRFRAFNSWDSSLLELVSCFFYGLLKWSNPKKAQAFWSVQLDLLGDNSKRRAGKEEDYLRQSRTDAAAVAAPQA
jgi:hypothetical protein